MGQRGSDAGNDRAGTRMLLHRLDCVGCPALHLTYNQCTQHGLLVR
jgi:hypothetical protein